MTYCKTLLTLLLTVGIFQQNAWAEIEKPINFYQHVLPYQSHQYDFSHNPVEVVFQSNVPDNPTQIPVLFQGRGIDFIDTFLDQSLSMRCKYFPVHHLSLEQAFAYFLVATQESGQSFELIEAPQQTGTPPAMQFYTQIHGVLSAICTFYYGTAPIKTHQPFTISFPNHEASLPHTPIQEGDVEYQLWKQWMYEIFDQNPPLGLNI
ncbi:MAG: hypothetical protein KDK51_06220, partial [Deltaproteobacteria bacterium]|nr:hypothetical protein [Deltaproteobacteria bacterium]